jgi:signal peptidase I
MTSIVTNPGAANSASIKKLGLICKAFYWLRNVLAIFGAFTIFYFSCFDVSQIISPSMSPTLRGDAQQGERGDFILTEKITYWFRAPHRWEVVRFWSPDGFWVMKRVAGLPGETLSIQDNWLRRDGVPLPRPPSLSFLIYYPFGSFRGGASAPCGTGYFVLGDYSKDSEDSRFEGPLLPNRIAGRPWLRIWPPSRFGWVNP